MKHYYAKTATKEETPRKRRTLVKKYRDEKNKEFF
jgi:hypothetical protein